MNKKVSLLVLLGCVVCIAAFMVAFQAESGELKEKKSHSFAQAKHQDYNKLNSDCRTRCNDAGGENCGYYTQNCCYKGSCSSGWSGETCNKRKPLDGCTTA